MADIISSDAATRACEQRLVIKDIIVTVVSVSYRSAKLLINCLRSLEGERATPGLSIRAIVIDNASGDFPALSKAVEDNGWTSWVTVLVAPRNGGFAYGNNIGIAVALERDAPDYVLLLNPDTEVRAGAVVALARFLEKNPEVGIAGSKFEFRNGSEWPIAFRFPSLVTEACAALNVGFITRQFERGTVAKEMSTTAEPVDWICGASMMIRPTVFTAIGGLDESYFLYFEETDFCLRARRAGFTTWYVPESKVMHISGQSTQVTDTCGGPKRLPSYWFESRRRFFVIAYGIVLAMAIDLCVLAIFPLGALKRALLRRNSLSVPHYLRDLWRQSVLWPRNWRLPRAQTQLTKEDAAGSPKST